MFVQLQLLSSAEVAAPLIETGTGDMLKVASKLSDKHTELLDVSCLL